jgi:16S rRNA C967 or C1407 C5-methylase (RsmB/RsmF family)
MEEASVSIRLNPFKGLDGPAGTPVPWSPYGRILSERPVFTLDPLFHAGCYYVQDSSAMYVGHLFRKLLTDYPPFHGSQPRQTSGCAGPFPLPSEAGPSLLRSRGWLRSGEAAAASTAEQSVIRVLDLCAAPGGKTTDLAASLRERCGDDFLLVANEVMKARVGVLDDNVARWGDPNVVVTSVDPAAFAQLRGYFDIIVADVPCSGEGMFRKDPRAREEWSPAVVELCASRQRRILADVWPALREGGWLLYSTCTYEAAENDDNLAWAAAELGGEILEPEEEFEDYGIRRTPHGHLLEAGVVPGEGQWAGALRKTASQPAAKKADLAVLHPLRPGGLRKGVLKGKDFVPDADYALSIKFDRNDYHCVDVDRQTALHFLHRDALVLPQAAPGYNAVTYLGHPLGFVKNIGNRCNNLLPKDRRILMNV